MLCKSSQLFSLSGGATSAQLGAGLETAGEGDTAGGDEEEGQRLQVAAQ